jgi:cell division septum initiation protein DivIVA
MRIFPVSVISVVSRYIYQIMTTPGELIKDIHARLDRMVREYRTLAETNRKLETENKSLAQRLDEARKAQEKLNQRLDTIHQGALRDQKGIETWKAETRKEVRAILKDVEKCLPQVESLLEKK